MADMFSRLRGLILDEAERRPSEIGRHPDGRPRADQIEKRMGLSKATVTRILLGRTRRTSDRPRKEDYEPTQAVMNGIQRLLRLHTNEDVWAAIINARPRPPQRCRQARRD
jgi:hypothetical protein